MAMLLKEIFTCYVSSTYAGDKKAFEKIQHYFQDAKRYTEEKWKQGKNDDTKAVFSKGKSLAFTFDYGSSVLEVRSIVDYSENDEQIIVSVGNSGFPFEAQLAKPRYQELLNKIDTWIKDSGINATPVS